MDQLKLVTVVPEKKGQPVYRLYRLIWLGLDWIYPPECGGCGKPYARWCKDCQAGTRLVSGPVCERCGVSLRSPGVCSVCLNSPPAYTAIRSWAVYTGAIRKAIHKLKYQGDISLGQALATPMIELLHQLDWSIDMVTPVPGSLARKKMRGYNQASLLALPIALSCRVQYRPGALTKIRDIPSQVGLSMKARHKNVQAVFQARNKDLVAGKSILVIDDIVTSGATMKACAQALLDQGAGQVYGLTLARAVLEDHL